MSQNQGFLLHTPVIGSASPKPLEINCSTNFLSWLKAQQISLAFTTYQTNRLFFLGHKSNGALAARERLFDKPMGLFARTVEGLAGSHSRLYMSTRYQIWQFESVLAAGEHYSKSDRLYIPRTAHTTGDLNVHDVAWSAADELVIVNTDFSCLATLSPEYSFVPLWQPPFISKLAAEDRCHLNGVAMVAGQPTYVTACSATDTAAGWRDRRRDGGVVMSVPDNAIVATGLSMPHSPRWYRDRLWLLNSGTGEFGWVDPATGTFEPLVFCPGFVRGLAFWQQFAIIGLSKLRSRPFTGLALEERLQQHGQTAQCGLVVIDLDRGELVHWVQLHGLVEELFDIVVLPGVRQPQTLGLHNDDIQRLVTFPGSQGICVTKPTVGRPGVGAAPPVAGLPNPVVHDPQSTPMPETETAAVPSGPVKYQHVFHLNPGNCLDYEALTFPSLQQRWQRQLPTGELLGVAASINGAMVGLAIAEQTSRVTAELISLLVLPACRKRGIGTQLVTYLERAWQRQGCQMVVLRYQPTELTRLALEPLLGKLNWQLTVGPGTVRQAQKTVGRPSLDTQSFAHQSDQAASIGTRGAATSGNTLALNNQVRQHFAQGKHHTQQGNLEAAVGQFQAALAVQPDYIPALNQLGNVLQALGRSEDALAAYQTILDLNPHVAAVHCNLGSLWQRQGDFDKALAAYQTAIDLQPKFLVAHRNLGKLRAEQGQYQAAEQALQQALQIDPTQAETHQELGHILRQMGRIQAAIDCFRAAIRYQPDYAEAYQSLGAMLMLQGKFALAQTCCEKVLALQPDDPLALTNLGHTLEAQGHYPAALTAYERALPLRPETTELLYRQEHLRLTLCDWQDYDQRMATLQTRIKAHLQDPQAPGLAPLFLNCFPFPIELHTMHGRQWSRRVTQPLAELKAQCHFHPPLTASGKLKLGYLSADFRRHAMGTLIQGLFQYHNRSQVEVYGYSLVDRVDPVTQQIQQGCDHFVHLSQLSTEAAARRIQADGIHILIDLAGYTSLCRPDILALQPAPIQVAYLGYPDTTGADFIQYLLADDWLIPAELEHHYTEQVVRLPHGWITTPLPHTPPTTTRAELGLPETGFVYACFNRTDKIDPHCFGSWMRILQQVPQGVLWLMDVPLDAQAPLRATAQAQGIAPERLIFTPRQSWPDFVTNCQLADLFLDTFNYNAGATAVTALQAGLPVLTCPGQTFAARMGASICAAAGLEAFICNSPQAYEHQAIALAQEPACLHACRQQLLHQKDQLPLFQPQTWIAQLETVLTKLWQGYLANQEPSSPHDSTLSSQRS